MHVLLSSAILLLLECAAISFSAPLPTPTAKPSNVFPHLDERWVVANYGDRPPTGSSSSGSEISPRPKPGLPVDYSAGVQLGSWLPGAGGPVAAGGPVIAGGPVAADISSPSSSSSSQSSSSLNSTQSSHTSTATTLVTSTSATSTYLPS